MGCQQRIWSITNKSRFNDWKFLKSEFASLVDASSLCGRVEVDLLNCGGGPQKGNSMCPILYSQLDDAFKYPWVGAAL